MPTHMHTVSRLSHMVSRLYDDTRRAMRHVTRRTRNAMTVPQASFVRTPVARARACCAARLLLPCGASVSHRGGGDARTCLEPCRVHALYSEHSTRIEVYR